MATSKAAFLHIQENSIQKPKEPLGPREEDIEAYLIINKLTLALSHPLSKD